MDRSIEEKRAEAKRIYETLRSEARRSGWIPVEPKKSILLVNRAFSLCYHSLASETEYIPSLEVLHAKGLGTLREGEWFKLSLAALTRMFSTVGLSKNLILESGTSVLVTRMR
jgi:hypothetical protein